MLATTPVYSGFVPCRRTRMRSPLGPLEFFMTPSTSTSMDSGLVPSNTVYATPRMPGLSWSTVMMLGVDATGCLLSANVERLRARTRATRKNADFFMLQDRTANLLHGREAPQKEVIQVWNCASILA